MEATASEQPESPASPPTSQAPLVFTETAIAKVREFLDTKPDAQGKMLRIFVQGGGCSGFEYGFSFDEHKEGDLVIPQGDIEVLLDSFSPSLPGGVSRRSHRVSDGQRVLGEEPERHRDVWLRAFVLSVAGC